MVSTNFVEREDRTSVSVTTTYASREVRDAVLAGGVAERTAECYERLARLLAER